MGLEVWLLFLGTATFLALWFYLLPRGRKSPTIQAALTRTSRSREFLFFLSNLAIAEIMALIAILALGWGKSMSSAMEALTILIWITLGFFAGGIIVVIYESACFINENRLDRKKAKRDEEIRPIAHRIWEQEGCPNGRDREHWDKAEAIWNELHKKKQKVESIGG